jgi:hypothetical protein
MMFLRNPLDTEYHFTNSDGWNALLIYIYKDFTWPPYLPQKMDCDDFAILFKGLVASNFGLNYFGITFGYTAAGQSHAFNTFRDETGLITFEPQNAQVIEDYISERILL